MAITWTPTSIAGYTTYSVTKWVAAADFSRFIGVTSSGQILSLLAGDSAPTVLGTNSSYRTLVASSDCQTVMVGGIGGFWRSTDYGVTFSSLISVTGTWTQMVCDATATVLYATAGLGNVKKSITGGLNWVDTNSASANFVKLIAATDLSTVYALVASNGVLYKTTDGGLNWTTASTLTSAGAIACSGDGTKLVYGMVSMVTAAYSTDSGSTWYECTVGSRAISAVLAAYTGTGSGGFVAISGGKMYYASSSDLTTWTVRAEGIAWAAPTLNSDGTKIIASDAAHAAISSDSGVTWTHKFTSTATAAVTRYSMSSNGSKAVAIAGGVTYTSIDGGATWTSRLGVVPLSSYALVKISRDGSTLYLGTASVLYKSTNMGASWQEITNLPVSLYSLMSLDCSVDGSKILIGTSVGGLISTDSCASWEVQSGFTGFMSFASISADGTKYVLAATGTMYQKVGVGSWTPITPPTVASTSFYTSKVAASEDGQKLVISTSTGVFTSVDGGAIVALRRSVSNVSPVSVCCSSNGNVIYAVVDNPSVIVKSSDSGVTWTTLVLTPTPTYIGQICCSTTGSVLYVVCLDDVSALRIYRSADGGSTWTTHDASIVGTAPTRLECSSTGATVIASSLAYPAQVSLDSGATWVTAAAQNGHMCCDGSGTKFMATAGNVYYCISDVTVGENWLLKGSINSPNYGTMNGDGTTLYVTTAAGSFYSSTDSGATWSAGVLIKTNVPFEIASRRDGTGTALAVGTYYADKVQTSSDSGATWTPRNIVASIPLTSLASDDTQAIMFASQSGTAPTSVFKRVGGVWSSILNVGGQANWQIVSSGDGQELLASTSTQLGTSVDGGSTWTAESVAGVTAWGVTTAAISGSGYKWAIRGTPGSAPTSFYRGDIPAPAIPTIVTGPVTISDGDDGAADGKITLTENMTVEATGNLTLDVAKLDDLRGGKTIEVKPHGRIKVGTGHEVEVLEGTKYKLLTGL